MSGLRILLIAPETNPNSLTNPSIAYHHGEALARLHEVTLLVYAANQKPVREAGGQFYAIEPIPLPWLDRLYEWAVRRIFKYDYGRQSLTAFIYPRHVCFELRAWWKFRRRILSGEFDVVLRIMPFVSVLPSPFAWFLRNGPIPFVIGPISGGLPWVKGFRQLDKQRQAPGYWIWNLRSLYRYMPFARSTYAKAAAIIAASSHTYEEFSTHREKLFFIPSEIGIHPSFFKDRPLSRSARVGKLELIFVGRLIPLKACDLALRAASPLLRDGAARFTIVGDGPERASLQELTKSLGIEGAVSFVGWLQHAEALGQLQNADVLVFPSLREIGGGVVFEALSLGAVPVVADFGGPGDIVNTDVGYRIPMTDEEDMIVKLASVLKLLAEDRNHLNNLRQRGMRYARENFTWDSKARLMTGILFWATGRGSKPKLQPPERLAPVNL